MTEHYCQRAKNRTRFSVILTDNPEDSPACCGEIARFSTAMGWLCAEHYDEWMRKKAQWQLERQNEKPNSPMKLTRGS